jgi:hypothetical protein
MTIFHINQEFARKQAENLLRIKSKTVMLQRRGEIIICQISCLIFKPEGPFE